MDLNKGSEPNHSGTGLPRQLIVGLLLNNAEPVAIAQRSLAKALSVQPLTIHAIAVDDKLVFQISFRYQQGGRDRNIVGTECGLGKSEVKSIRAGWLLIIKLQTPGQIESLITAATVTTTVFDSCDHPAGAILNGVLT